MTAADFELVFDKEECVYTNLCDNGDNRCTHEATFAKLFTERVLKIIEAYQIAMKQGAEAVKIPMADDKERENWHTFRYRLNAAAEALGIDVKVSIRQDEALALVTLPKAGKGEAAKATA